MVEVGYTLSSEDHGPRDLVRFAGLAEEHGFTRAWISDHFHPWVDAQGHSPFVWAVLGGVAATTGLEVGTGVTCPTVRIHPAVVAQAVATTSLLFDGRFWFGVGSGEALNEHILGGRWPEAEVRLEMLEEAVQVMRRLWTGEVVSHHGRHYTVENARLYDAPERRVPVYVSAFGPKAMELAGRIGDGYVGTSPDAELVRRFARQAPGKPKVAGAKCCWHADEAEARRLAHRLWPNMGLPGELAQELPTPQHFMQAARLVTEEMVAGPIPTGPDPRPYVDLVRAYADAGYDVVYLHNIGEDQEGFLRFWTGEVRPLLAEEGLTRAA
ncbi:MAG TPA: TIGR03557 family F420-dependent LLM class oxidoreductase [Egibacteraceae bacterium]|nr:TIGR03557 family F420-dependent LLM class oxidoreductase [Egibacteraceae bacterium]